jgi:hypothetical protein
MSMVTVSFRYTVPDEQFDSENGPHIAQRVADFPGLLWKIWLHDPLGRRCQGVYRFESEEAAESYINGPVVAHLREAGGYHDVTTVRWEVLAEQSVITRAPGLDDVLAAAR